MKFNLTATAIFLFTTAMVNAQVKYGVRAGVNMANWQGDAVKSINSIVNATNGYLDTKGRTGFFAGGYVNLPIAKGISIEPGLLYSQKGYTLNGDIEVPALKFLGANASAQVQSHYIDIPVLVRAEVVKGLSVYAGPQVSYLVKNNLRVDAGVLGISLLRSNLDIADQFKRLDMGIVAGATYKFANGFQVQAGYDYGLSRVDANGSFKSFNRVIKVGIGYEF
jgi:Outer membrane protein beta-barrel domain